jgi:spore maturation protein CgeB
MIAPRPCATLRAVRWLIALPFQRAGLMGVDFADELKAMGHEARLFPYRRDNVVYKNRSTKAAYQLWILRRLERVCLAWRPDVVLVIKGGPVTPGLIRRVKARIQTRFVNFFPDNPLWMIPFECIEAYDVFFTKERYAMASLQQVGLRNLHYLPMYCVPSLHHPVTLTAEERHRFASPLSFVGSRYDYRERLVRELADTPLRVWGQGWARSDDPVILRMAGDGPVYGRDKLAVYAGSTLSLNHHHPMNDIVGVNTRAFELAAAGACQLVDAKEDVGRLFKPGEEVLVYRDLAELRRHLDHYLARPDEARAIGENARRRALAEHTLRHRLEAMLDVLSSIARAERPRRP